MARHLVRHAEVRWTGEDGELVYARRGELVDVPDAEAARLTELGALVPEGTDLALPVDDRPREQMLQQVADRRYDVVRVP